MEFKPVYTLPDLSSKFFKSYNYGGINTCKVLDTEGSVLPNCVGFAQGRLLESAGATAINWKLPAGNANQWYETAKANGMQVGSDPKLGAVICFKGGQFGHIGFVEQIDADGTIWVSQSSTSGSYFYRISKVPKPYNLDGYTLEGFIYNTVEFSNEVKTETAPATCIYHTVVKGDTLWSIAEKYLGKGKRYPEIMLENNMKKTVLNIGMKLKIPPK